MYDGFLEIEMKVGLDEINDIAMVVWVRKVVPEPGSFDVGDGEGRIPVCSQGGMIEGVMGLVLARDWVMA
jgi:hypothetical protein